MAKLTKVISTTATGLVGMFAANAASAQTSVAVAPTQTTNVQVPIAIAPTTTSQGGNSAVDLNNTNNNSNANANSLQDNSTTNNQNANANNNTNQNSNANSAQNNNSGNSQNANANSATVNNNEKGFKTVLGIGIVAGVGDFVAQQRAVAAGCVTIGGVRVMAIATQGDALLSANKAEMLLPQMSKKERAKFAKANNLQADAVTGYMPCVEEPQVNFPQPAAAPVPPPVIVLPAPIVQVTPMLPAYKARRTTVKFSKPKAKVCVCPPAKPTAKRKNLQPCPVAK